MTSRYLLQLLVLSVHQRLPVIVKLDIVSLNVLQGSLPQYRAVLHRDDLKKTDVQVSFTRSSSSTLSVSQLVSVLLPSLHV